MTERGTELAVPAQQTAIAAQSPVQWAIANNVSPEQMLQYYQLDREIKRDAARVAYNEAMNKFKANLPTITKNKHVRFETSKGITEYDHATHDHVVKILVPALNAVGIRHHWLPAQADGMMTVSCVLTHELGHQESASLTAAYDQSGGKNAIQAVVSAKTYLERHTFLAVTGLSTEGIDDDGRKAGGFALLAEVLANIAAEDNPDNVVGLARNGYKAAKSAKDNSACAAIVKAKDARLKELGIEE